MATTWRVTNCARYTECPSGRGVDGADTHAGESNVIYNVSWMCQDQVNHDDGTFTGARRQGDTAIEPFGGGVLIPYADITEAEIIEWLHDTLGDEVQRIETEVADELVAKQQPPTEAAGLPWRLE